MHLGLCLAPFLPALSIVLSLRRCSLISFLLYVDVGVLRVVTTGPFSLTAPFYWVFRIVPQSRKADSVEH